MASIFLSYKTSDYSIARALEHSLKRLGHEPRMDVGGLVPGDDWRRSLFDALAAADAQVAVLTESSLESQFVLAEIGTGRAFRQLKGTIVIPVLVGWLEVPEFIKDLFAIRLSDASDLEIARAAEEIDGAIRTHIARSRGKYPRIFVSHRHKDAGLVTALTQLLEAGLSLEPGDIRCTSVHPYKLKVGERTPDRLRAEISRAKAVLGVVTPDARDSSYVLFELGAAWGQDVLTFPLLAKGATMADIPSPISDRHPLNLSEVLECGQLIEDLSDATALPRRRDNPELLSKLINALVAAATVY